METVGTFGAWLRNRREALDLTRNELARRVNCSPHTLRNYEGNQRRPSKEMAERLATALNLPPKQRTAFLKLARTGQGTTTAIPELLAAWVPFGEEVALPADLLRPLTPLIGREQDVALVSHYLRDPHKALITLTGPAGVGKTRLGLELAARLTTAFDRVVWVSLAALRDPALVLPTLAQVVGLGERDGETLPLQLYNVLLDQQMLLVLDNFEQVIAAAADILALCQSCPLLTVLVTSRRPLHVRGEQQFPLAPLTLPLPDIIGSETSQVIALAQNPAVALFVERIQAVLPRWTLSPSNAVTIAAVCTRLDGLPLALELVAARSAVLSPQALLDQLTIAQPTLALLTQGPIDLPPRQQSLHTAIDWSYHLLDPSAQALFRCLGVFVGGWTLAAVEAVYGGWRLGDEEYALNPHPPTPISPLPAILDLLQTLVDNSLVQTLQQPDGDNRYTMLETIREFAVLSLAEAEAEHLRERHAQFYLELVEQAEPQLWGTAQDEWYAHLARERDNVRAALTWCLSHGDLARGLRIAGALWLFWEVQGQLREGLHWLQQLLTQPAASLAPVPLAVRAKALNAAGNLARDLGEWAVAFAYHSENLALHQALGDQLGISRALNNLGVVTLFRGDPAGAVGYLEASLALKRTVGDTIGISIVLFNLGDVAYAQHDYAQAQQHYEDSLRIKQELGEQRGSAQLLNALASLARQRNAWQAAQALHTQALERSTLLGDKRITAYALHGLGQTAFALGVYTEAREWYRQSLHSLGTFGAPADLALVFSSLAQLAVAQHQPTLAAQLLGTVERLGVTPVREAAQGALPNNAATKATARDLLDPVAFATAWQAGASLPLAQVMHLLLGDS